MDVDLLSVEICLVVLLLLYIVVLVKELLKHRAIYALKWICNSAKCFLWTLGAIYIALFGILPLPYLTEYFKGFRDKQIYGSLGYWVFVTVPMVYAIILVIVVLYVAWNGYKPFFKYNEQEQQWQREEREKLRSQTPMWLRWIWNKPMIGKSTK